MVASWSRTAVLGSSYDTALARLFGLVQEVWVRWVVLANPESLWGRSMIQHKCKADMLHTEVTKL